MRQIRCNVFETNSSSTHSLCICDKSEYEEWGKSLWFDMDSEEFIPAGWTDEQINKVKEDYEYDRLNDRYGHGSDTPWDELDEESKNEQLSEYYWSICSSEEEWRDKHDLEEYYTEYTTKSGDQIVVFGRFGYDG